MNLLGTRWGRLLTFSLLYLSEGIPFGFSAIALTVYLRQNGVGLAEIGAFTGSLYAPWGFKWAWAPIVDLVHVRRFGHRRFWIMLAQALMIVTLGMIMFFDVSQNLPLLTLLIAIHNVFAATQDVAIDALAIEVLPERERGVANGFMFGSSYLGQAVGGAGALFVAGKYGWPATFPFVCATLALILTFVVFLREPPKAIISEAAHAVERGAGFLATLVKRLGGFFRELFLGFFKSGPGPLVGVILAILPVGAIALGLALGSTMQVDLGMNEDQIAKLTLWTTVASALGCVLGGFIADRIGHRVSLAIWVALTTVPTILLAREFTGTHGMEGVTLPEFWKWMVAYSFAAGLTNASSIAVYMGLTSPKVAGTQFTGYMALKNLVYTYSSNWQGRMAEARGYPTPMRWDCLIALVPLLFYPWLRPSTRAKKEQVHAVPSHQVLHPEAIDPVPTMGKGA